MLDNLRSRIVGWRQTGYRWVMRQSTGNPRFWVELNGGQSEPAYASHRATGRFALADAGRVAPGRQAGSAVFSAQSSAPALIKPPVEEQAAAPDLARHDGDAVRAPAQAEPVSAERPDADWPAWLHESRLAAPAAAGATAKRGAEKAVASVGAESLVNPIGPRPFEMSATAGQFALA